ncbi:MAG: hypothetical protein PF689_07530 [Deltaproteobacteria bacterium]|jgi:hypothetical protein|nr:hypothetical protein [Deltaproteobacteria bacterium]
MDNDHNQRIEEFEERFHRGQLLIDALGDLNNSKKFPEGVEAVKIWAKTMSATHLGEDIVVNSNEFMAVLEMAIEVAYTIGSEIDQED